MRKSMKMLIWSQWTCWSRTLWNILNQDVKWSNKHSIFLAKSRIERGNRKPMIHLNLNIFFERWNKIKIKFQNKDPTSKVLLKISFLPLNKVFFSFRPQSIQKDVSFDQNLLLKAKTGQENIFFLHKVFFTCVLVYSKRCFLRPRLAPEEGSRKHLFFLQKVFFCRSLLRKMLMVK